ncbi:MAG: type II toxin-antitoxin system HicB family antitoxin [Actinomycetota bacterium]|nr:type II toxin-antitoxin system HicB family antitoxin [Actinomycetota bacterium]
MADAPVKTIEYYMSLPYTVETKRTEDGYFANVLELPGCTTDTADTLEELKPMIKDAQLAWIEDALEAGAPVPEPLPEPRSESIPEPTE